MEDGSGHDAMDIRQPPAHSYLKLAPVARFRVLPAEQPWIALCRQLAVVHSQLGSLRASSVVYREASLGVDLDNLLDDLRRSTYPNQPESNDVSIGGPSNLKCSL